MAGADVGLALSSGVKSIAIVLLLNVFGAGLARIGILTQDALKSGSRLTTQVLLPALVFSKTGATLTVDMLVDSWVLVPAALVYIGVGNLVGQIVSRGAVHRDNTQLRMVFVLACGYNNANALPLVLAESLCAQGLFGEDCFDKAATMLFLWGVAWHVLFWTIGYSALSKGAEVANAGPTGLAPVVDGTPAASSRCRKVVAGLVNVPLCAVFAGIVVALVDPVKTALFEDSGALRFVGTACEIVGDGAVPMITLIIAGNLGHALPGLLKQGRAVAPVCCGGRPRRRSSAASSKVQRQEELVLARCTSQQSVSGDSPVSLGMDTEAAGTIQGAPLGCDVLDSCNPANDSAELGTSARASAVGSGVGRQDHDDAGSDVDRGVCAAPTGSDDHSVNFDEPAAGSAASPHVKAALADEVQAKQQPADGASITSQASGEAKVQSSEDDVACTGVRQAEALDSPLPLVSQAVSTQPLDAEEGVVMDTPATATIALVVSRMIVVPALCMLVAHAVTEWVLPQDADSRLALVLALECATPSANMLVVVATHVGFKDGAEFLAGTYILQYMVGIVTMTVGAALAVGMASGLSPSSQ